MSLQRKNIDNLILSVLFSSLVTIWHAFFFPVRVNSRVVLQPWLLQRGFIPYAQIGDEHAPLLPHVLSWLSELLNLDGLSSARLLHAVLIWSIIFVCIWFVYKQGGRWAAIGSGAFFLVASNNLGFWAMWYDLAVAPLFLAAYFIIIDERISLDGQLFFIGLVSGIGFLVKQHAILLTIIVPLLLIFRLFSQRAAWRLYVKAIFVSLAGFLLPIMAYVVYFLSLTNDWFSLWYWLIEFNIRGEYRSLGAKLPGLHQLKGMIPLFAMLLPFTLHTCYIEFLQMDKREAGKRWWLLFIMMITAVMLYPRYSTMHWATMLPFLAIASGIASGEIVTPLQDSKPSQRYVQWGVYFAIVGFLWIGPATINYIEVYRERDSRSLLEYDGLPELAEQITNLAPLETILLFPDDEGVGNLYYLLEKEPPPFWMMNYPWFRNEYEIEKWLAEIDKAEPNHVIYFASRGPQNYPEFDQIISDRYRTIYQLEWKNQIVEIKERIPATSAYD